MGRRLMKLLGYGLTDVQTDGSRITDPRINASSILLDEDRGPATLRDLVRSTVPDDATAERLLSGWQYGNLDPESIEPFDSVEHCWGTELENVLILRPVMYRDWFRSNDFLDIIEHECRHGEPTDTVTELPHGIYPYSNNFVDVSTGERLNWYKISAWVRAANTPGTAAEVLSRTAGEAGRELGWGEDLTHAALSSRIVPEVPEEVRFLAAYGSLFTDPDTVHRLRPMLVTCWR